jgi:hypothetical protein
MVLPLLLSMGLPALVGSGALGAGTFLAGLSAPALAGIGAGLGSFIETGDLGTGIRTGLTSFLGGKLLGGLTGSASPAAMASAGGPPITGAGGPPITGAGGPQITGLDKGLVGAGQTGFLSGILGPSPSATEAFAAAPMPKFFNQMAPNAPAGIAGLVKGATLPGVFPAAYIGQSMTDLSMMEKDARKKRAAEAEANKPPMPRPMQVTQNVVDPYAAGQREGTFFQYVRPPAPDGYTPQYPYFYAKGGLVGLRRMQEGGDVEVEVEMENNGMNEKDVIVEAIRAIKGASENPEIALGMFVRKYGDDALRDLVERVQSGELDETVDRFVAGDKGMVRGPGDGSGVDDMVPATLDGEQDVLLSDGEYVLRKKTADALEKAYGGGFLDVVNRAEGDAPRKLEAMVG